MSGSATYPSIPISTIIDVIPGVLAAGGSTLQLNGLFLTETTRVPIGTVYSFPSAQAVGAFFGTTSLEYATAGVYFAGFSGMQQTPAAMLLAQYPASAVGAWLQGGSLASVTLTQLQAFSGTLTITVNGTPLTSSTITLSAATSFSNAATIIAAAFTSPPFGVVFDSVSNAFIFTTTATGATETITYATTGTLATDLALTQAAGAIISQGAAAAVPATFMTTLTQTNQNFATFTTLFNPDGNTGLNTVKQAFQAWNNAQSNRYLYVVWDTDVTATEQGTTTSLGYILKQLDSSGYCAIYDPNGYFHSAFLMGFVAALDFGQQNGRFTAAYRTQTGLQPEVTSQQIAVNLIANGYNFFGTFGNAELEDANIFWNGSVGGPFAWVDTYVDQIWLNNGLQAALFALEQAVGNIPYNAYGRSLIRQSLVGDSPGSAGAGPIQAAVWFGAIRAGVTLSATEVASITAAVGVTNGPSVVQTIQNQGWYLLVGEASAAVRAARGSPPITLWYTDGQSMQTLTLNSVEVQ